jgi:hypothetical protein
MITAQHTSNSIFQSIGQALQVAYLVMSVDPRQDAPMRTALLRMMEATKNLTPEQADWYDELRGSVSGTINFSGLTSIEIRAQCALITLSVRSKLPPQEMWAIQARYGQVEHEVASAKKRYAFPAERIAAIQGLSQWLNPLFPRINSLALDCILAKNYANHAKVEISFRDLEKSFGENHMVYARAFPKIKEHLAEVEKQATDRLAKYFVSQGIIPNEIKSA